MPGIDWTSFAPFVVTSFLIELTPGPNLAYLALLSMQRGRRAGYMAVVGVSLGLLLLGLAAAFGVAALVSSSPVLFQVLRWAGVAYLCWLAWETWRDAGRADDGGETRDQRYFTRGLITNLLNPKAALFYITVLPAFLGNSEELRANLVYTLAYVIVATLVHAGVVTIGGFVQPLGRTGVRRWPGAGRSLAGLVDALIACRSRYPFFAQFALDQGARPHDRSLYLQFRGDPPRGGRRGAHPYLAA